MSQAPRTPHPGAAVQRPGAPLPPPAPVEVFYGDVTGGFMELLGDGGLGGALGAKKMMMK